MLKVLLLSLATIVAIFLSMVLTIWSCTNFQNIWLLSGAITLAVVGWIVATGLGCWLFAAIAEVVDL